MATSSIFSSIQINDEKSARALVSAMEAAVEAKAHIKPPSVKIKELSNDEVKSFFKKKPTSNTKIYIN